MADVVETCENTLHMLNPYKFATWQFMKQYFSVSPSMYFNYTNIGSYDSYNKLFYKMIMPFEPKFDNATGQVKTTVNVDGHPCTEEWAKNNIPIRSYLQRDFHNLRNTADTNLDKKIMSGNTAGTLADKGCIASGGTYYVGDQTNYFYPYHGSIFAAVIPIFTLNRVIKHNEIHEYASGHNDVATPNFFSTYTRTGYPQDGSTGLSDNYISFSAGEHNIIFANSGLYSTFIGSRNAKINDTTVEYSRENYVNCNDMNFTSPGYNNENVNMSAFKILNRVMNNVFDYPNDVGQIETDVIYGLAKHTDSYSRRF